MPRKYESTTEEYSNEPTEFDKKCAELINLFNLSRPSLDDFRGRRNYDDAQIDRDENVVWLKQRGREERIGEYNATDQDKVLESIIYHMGAGHQLFAQETYTEPQLEPTQSMKNSKNATCTKNQIHHYVIKSCILHMAARTPELAHRLTILLAQCRHMSRK